MKLDVNVNRTELTMRLLRTTRMKRAGDGMLANGELAALSSRAGRVPSLRETVRFFGVLGDMIELLDIESKNTKIQS